MASLKYWVWLSSLPKVGNVLSRQLLERFGDPEKIYCGDQEAYYQVKDMTREAARSLGDKSLTVANRILGDCDRLGLRILTIQDTEYPDRLRNIYDPPIVLYVQGQLPLLDDEVTIAMVGSRKASPYALEVGERLAFDLASRGAVVVSGLAAGGDAAAHRGALRAGGKTVAVIGGGHDIKYPWENRLLYEDIACYGAIVSEYPPGTQHAAAHFPARNRIISGVSHGTVVVEAPAKSGTLITAGQALEQGRDVYAVPGRLGDPSCVGSNRLLRDGAGVVTEASDILDVYADRFPHRIKRSNAAEPQQFGQISHQEPEARKDISAEERKKTPPAQKKPVLDLKKTNSFTEDQLAVLHVLGDGTTRQVDEIIEAVDIPAGQVLTALTMLEIDGIVIQESGKRFALAVTIQ